MGEPIDVEYYYVYKDEKRDAKDGNPAHINTIGTRIMPKFSPSFNGNFELTGQWGTQAGTDKSGLMFDSVVNWKLRTVALLSQHCL